MLAKAGRTHLGFEEARFWGPTFLRAFLLSLFHLFVYSLVDSCMYSIGD